jgi:hypothetical protein
VGALFFAVTAADVNLPMLVAGVFFATFLVVCAVAYALLGRSTSRGAPPPPPVSQPPMPVQESAASLAPDDGAEAAAVSIGTLSPRNRAATSAFETSAAVPGASAPDAADRPAAPAPLDAGKLMMLRLYRLLMFATGGAGLLAAFLMFSAVTEFSRLVVIATVVLVLACMAIYRGFFPDPELTGRKK